MAYSHQPFKLAQYGRVNCGRGYSGRGQGSAGAHGVRRMGLGLLEQNEKLCVTCHNENSPTSPGPFKFDKNKGVHDHFPMTKWFKEHQFDR